MAWVLATFLAACSDTNTIKPVMLVSRGARAYASSEQYPAHNANDASYDSQWRSKGPGWIAYDLSSVPAARRRKLAVVWYNNDTGVYDHTAINVPAYNLPRDYTLEGNPSPGATGVVPTAGWVALLRVADNHYHSRQHVIDFNGYNWLRMNVSNVDGSLENSDVALNLDVYDATVGLDDDWIFFGDSITQGAMGHESENGVASFSQLVNQHAPSYFPIEEDGGIGYLLAGHAATYIAAWLRMFPGKYVGLSYGTNDALGCEDPAVFRASYSKLVKAVLAAGKVPVVPRIPWGATPEIQRCAPKLNEQIQSLYQAFPAILPGPDFWAYFQANPGLISGDGIHPSSPAGMAAYRRQWANAMLTTVYRASSQPS